MNNNYLITGLFSLSVGTMAFLNKNKIQKTIESFTTIEDAQQTIIPENMEDVKQDMLNEYWNNMDIENKKDSKEYERQVIKENNEDTSKLESSEFLPQELNKNWFDKDFNKVTEIDQDTLIDVSQYSSGMDTVGQTLKNPSYDIRGNIPNPKNVISPFLNSSIEPDNNIKSWC